MNYLEINRLKAQIRKIAGKYGNYKVRFIPNHPEAAEFVYPDIIVFNLGEVVRSPLWAKVTLLHEIGHKLYDEHYGNSVRDDVNAERFAYKEVQRMKDPLLFTTLVNTVKDFERSPHLHHRKAYKYIRNFPIKYSFNLDW